MVLLERALTMLTLITHFSKLKSRIPDITKSNLKLNTVIQKMDFDLMKEYLDVTIRVTLACSPILIIAYILLTANDDEEEEKAKRELAKKSKNCGKCC